MHHDPALVERLVAELGLLEADGELFTIQIAPFQAFALVAQVQLAARHPDNRGSAAAIALETARRIVALFPPGSALRTIAAQGFDPRFDVPTGATPGAH